jgi:tetratricopeptide (TPR) repeat protein
MVQLYTPKDTATNTAFGKRLLPAISIHTLAGFAAARKSPPDDLVQGAIAALRNHKAGEGERELYCTAIPALFAAGRVAEANEFFIVLKTLQEPGCDEAFDRTERGAKPPLPCIEEERIARALIQLGKFDNALEIVRTCDDSDRLRTILLRAAIGTDDRTAGTRLLDAATPKGDVPADETLLRAAVLAKLGRLEEAYDLAKPFLDDPQRWLDMRRENIFRPLFDEFIKADKPERLLDHVIRGQKLVIKANDDLRVSTYQTLELARMLSEANRPDELFAIGDALISSVTDEANRALVQASPRPLIDAAEVAILIGQRDKAAEMLSSAATYVTMMATDGASRTGQLIRMLAISYSVSPDAIKNSVAELVAAIPYEPDAEERARLYSIVSGAHLKNGDPVFAIHFAQEAGLPHRVLEAYCRVLDQAIKTSAVRPPADYGLGYAYWPSPSFIGAEKSIVFRDSFGPLTCDAPRPVDRRN